MTALFLTNQQISEVRQVLSCFASSVFMIVNRIQVFYKKVNRYAIKNCFRKLKSYFLQPTRKCHVNLHSFSFRPLYNNYHKCPRYEMLDIHPISISCY